VSGGRTLFYISIREFLNTGEAEINVEERILSA
jgi:hypothetical protein